MRTLLLSLSLLLWSGPLLAELRLGFLPGEPAPSVAAIFGGLNVDGEQVVTVPQPSMAALLEALEASTVDVALLEEPATLLAGVRSIADLYPSVLHVLHREAISPSSFRDLLSAGPVYTGAPGGAGDRLARALAEDYALEANEFEVLESALAEEPEVYFIFGGLLARDAVGRLGGYRLWSLDDPANLMHGSTAEALMLRYPNMRPFVLPGGLYPTLGDAPALTVAVSTLLVARAGLEEDRVYALAAATERAAPAIAAVYPLAGLPQLMANQQSVRTLELHPGAQRYLDRNEPNFLERYAEVLALGFSLVIALGSASLAIERRRRQARKDRLDVYYQRVLGERPGAAASSEERQAANAAIRAIQAEVFELVVQERIDADDSLVAFLTLSNQALAETEGA